MNTSDEKLMKSYLRTLRWALSKLPGEDRDEIVAETESHFRERLAGGGAAFDAVAAELGHAEDYARSFLSNYEISVALGSGNPWHMFVVALKSVGKGFVALVGFLWFLLLYGGALILLAMAVLKPIIPQYVGVWVGEGVFAMGVHAGTRPTEEVLGYWIIPVGLIAAVVIYLMANRMLKGFLRTLRG